MAKPERLIYLALGGAGEIGMNMYLYGYGPEGNERFILVDMGVTFPTMESTPGVDLIMADPAYIQARADRLDGIFITHGHEDHVGALGLLWHRLRAPVYARRFTAALAKGKMERSGQPTDAVRQVDAFPHQVHAGPFRVGFLPIAHSIPESSALVIDTPAGRILHTGDFKADPTPLVGEPFDPAALRAIGEHGVKAMACDSTNVFSPHAGRSEMTLIEPLNALMRDAEGLVVATTFASNVARLRTLAEAGRQAGRRVVVLGRAMNTMLKTAHAAEVLEHFPEVLDPLDMDSVPRRDLLVLATGSQGERRAATAQLAQGRYMGLELKPGDTYLFSSRTIPGNEVPVSRILNLLSERGVKVIDDTDGLYHVSGHANRPDLAAIHELVKPQMLIPMHGEHRHLVAHAALAAERGIPAAIAPNGTVVDLTGDAPVLAEHIDTGRLYLDGTQLIGALDGIVRERIRMALRGHVAVNIIIDERGKPMGGSWVELTGLPDNPKMRDGLAGALEAEIDRVLSRAKRNELADDESLDDLIQRAVSRISNDAVGKKPVCKVMISRLEA
ncbi:ribonuclease J [Amaricoccus macauensis]|uniref:Ribonuclease J n=1 Tax=Amaricoccus macauensis TaxID=57001 RepID=A0A840SFW3_9RHOB|nr:ribonuclease J [Amaricoccus macauensis]MBB5221829.1 ribonuclease J [Amaricoccus macauensis]